MRLSHFRVYTLSRSYRKGSMAILLVLSIGTASFITANKFAEDSMYEYRISLTKANGYKAQLLAKAGMQGALGALKKIPIEFLYKSGIAFDPPAIPLAGGFIQYKIRAEDGKFNINSLVKPYDDEPNERAIEYFSRLYEQLGLDRSRLFPVIDWIDTNEEPMGGGAEEEYYARLEPPRKIKNNPLYSLTELLAVKEYDREILYYSRKEEIPGMEKSESFLSEEEKLMIGESDYILANNITAFIPYETSYDQRININAAPYFVLMSLSDFMTPAAAKKIIKLRLENNGYIKDMNVLNTFPEFQSQSSGGLTLFKELAGEGNDISSGRIKTSADLFRITGIGISKNKVVRTVTCLYDVKNGKLIYYSEN